MAVNLGRTQLDTSLLQSLLAPYTSLLAGQPDPTASLLDQTDMLTQALSGGTTSDGPVDTTGNLMTRNGVTMVAPALRSLIQIQRQTGTRILPHVVSSWRSRAQQQQLYQAYLNGTGNLAAPPGSSLHESGLAVDISTSFLNQHPEIRRALLAAGWHNDVPGEPWHWSYGRSG